MIPVCSDYRDQLISTLVLENRSDFVSLLHHLNNERVGVSHAQDGNATLRRHEGWLLCDRYKWTDDPNDCSCSAIAVLFSTLIAWERGERKRLRFGSLVTLFR